MSNIRYCLLCFLCTVVSNIVYCVVFLFVVVLCLIYPCCWFFLIVHSLVPLRYSLLLSIRLLSQSKDIDTCSSFLLGRYVGDQPLLRVRVRGKSLNKVTIGQIKVIPEVSIYPISSRFFTGARLSKEAPFLLFQAFYTPHLHLLSTTVQSGRTFRTRVSVNFVYFILQIPFYFVDGV